LAAALTRTVRRQPIQTAVAAVLLTLGLLSSAPARTQGGAAATGDDIRVLDAQVQMILAEARRQQEQLAVQRERLERAEAANAWLPWLAAGLVGLGGLSGWLGWRLWRLRRDQPVAAQAPAAAAPAPDADMTPVDMAALVAAAMPDSVPAQLPQRGLLSTPAPARSAAATAHAPVPAPAAAVSPTTAVPPPRMTPLQRDRSGAPLSTRDFSMGARRIRPSTCCWAICAAAAAPVRCRTSSCWRSTGSKATKRPMSARVSASTSASMPTPRTGRATWPAAASWNSTPM
jgi:hypothetical protein